MNAEEREKAMFELREALCLRVRVDQMREEYPESRLYQEAYQLVNEAVHMLQQRLFDDRLSAL